MRTPEEILPAAPAPGETPIPLRLIPSGRAGSALSALSERERAWAAACGFTGRPGQTLLTPAGDGKAARALAGVDDGDAPSLERGGLARRLPEGLYMLEEPAEAGADPGLFALGWLLSAYDFSRYRKEKRPPARLLCPPGADREDTLNQAAAIRMARDLINTPAEDLGPAQLAEAAGELAEQFGATARIVTGEALAREYPLAHAVGRGAAADRAPRVIDMRWGEETAPRVSLVGKGVCFDTGGLDIKPPSGMLLMKKDMGGAAAVLALARMIMAAGLPVRLRVIAPAVDNAVSGGSIRPSDVLRSRKGLSVEVGNTDAEGRLILADALSAADEERPELLIDMATLTGAARAALGAEIAALFTRHDDLAAALTAEAAALDDPLWRLPLWEPYMEGLKTPVADTSNIADHAFAGAIIAALFLSRFVNRETNWAHLDQSGWNFRDRPARPKGGEALAVRAVFGYLKKRFG